MTLSGPQAMRSLDDALRDIRREEDDIAKRLSRGAEIVARIRETEGEQLRQLAALRLDPVVRGEIAGSLSRAEAKARDMLKSHAAAVGAAEDRLRELDKRIAALAGERQSVLAAVETRQAELAGLAKVAEASLAGDAAYAEAKRIAAELAAVADEAMDKTAQAEADREQKGRPYRDDALFSYLWERRYGTRDYSANNLVRLLDGWVARLVGYARARPNFAMLNEIPLRLREHAERQKASAAAAALAQEALEIAAMDRVGGRPAREAMAAAQARMAAIDTEMLALEDQRDDAAKTQRELAQGADPAFAAATAALAEGLGREDIQSLLAAARQTHTSEDDTIVKQIDEARARAAEEEAESRDHKERLKTLAARRRELEDIQYEFKKSNFDDPRSRFGRDELVGDVLTEFLRGGITAASYWDQWQKSQNWQGGLDNIRPDNNRRSSGGSGGFSWPDSSFGGSAGGGSGGSVGGVRLPRGGFGGSWGRLPTGGGTPSGSSGGGFSRPRTGSAGSRKGGGFKTGGGF